MGKTTSVFIFLFWQNKNVECKRTFRLFVTFTEFNKNFPLLLSSPAPPIPPKTALLNLTLWIHRFPSSDNKFFEFCNPFSPPHCLFIIYLPQNRFIQSCTTCIHYSHPSKNKFIQFCTTINSPVMYSLLSFLKEQIQSCSLLLSFKFIQSYSTLVSLYRNHYLHYYNKFIQFCSP